MEQNYGAIPQDQTQDESDKKTNEKKRSTPAEVCIDIGTSEPLQSFIGKAKQVSRKISDIWKTIRDQVTTKESAFRIHWKQFKREFFQWGFVIFVNAILSLCSWALDNGTGAGAFSGIAGWIFAGLQFISLVDVFSMNSKFVFLHKTGSAAGLQSELRQPNKKEMIPLLVVGGLLIVLLIIHNAVVVYVVPVTIFQMIVVAAAISFRWKFPEVMIQREAAIFPTWPKGSLRYRQMVGREFFDHGLINDTTDQPVEQGRGYFKKVRTRCCCDVAIDEIQITTDRVTMVTTYLGNIWNCCKPDHQEYTDAWLAKSPGLSVREPEVICCCCSYIVPMSSVSAVKFATNLFCCSNNWCCCALSICTMLDEFGVYTHTPCNPSRHVIVGQEGIGLVMRVAIEPPDEQILVNTFYEATQKYNHKPEENGALDNNNTYVVPQPQIMVGYPPTQFHSKNQ